MKERKQSNYNTIDLDRALQRLPDESKKSGPSGKTAGRSRTAAGSAQSRQAGKKSAAGASSVQAGRKSAAGASSGQTARKSAAGASSGQTTRKSAAGASFGQTARKSSAGALSGQTARKSAAGATSGQPGKKTSAGVKSAQGARKSAAARGEAEIPGTMRRKAKTDAARQRAQKEEQALRQELKKEEKKNRMTNKEFVRVTYLFVTLFLGMIGYLVYFNIVRGPDIINSPYNVRQDLLADRVIRGDIVDSSGEVLAETVTAEDGSEVRQYPYGDLFAHVVGYASNGKAGLESEQNFPLLTSHAFFLEKLQKEFQDQKNMGDTVVTTLDAGLQQAAYDALGSNKGAVVVMEASTGKILAMVSKPAFNANAVADNWDELNNDEDSALLNRATLGQYAPGSTFKVVTTLEYMREHADYEDYSYECAGEISQDGTTIHCYDSEVHGWESLADSVANSCNTSFSNIGLSLDRKAWRKTADELLFDEDLPSDLPYRQSRFRLETDDSSAEAMMTAMGQGDTQVSPYHMAMITAAIANGGKLMKPYLVDRVTNYTGTTVKKYMPEKYADLMTSQEAAQLVEYMKGVVDYGTGGALSGESYTVAGKTGTAEVSMDKESVHSWFIGFSNVENPELVVSAVVENADTSSITGVSVAKQIFNAYYY